MLNKILDITNTCNRFIYELIFYFNNFILTSNLNRFVCFYVIIFFLIITCNFSYAEKVEYKIKAAYLYRFTQFTKWPNNLFDSDTTPIKFCILGKNPFGKYLDYFFLQESQNRSLLVEHLSSINVQQGCHVIFISKSKDKELSNILQHIKNTPVLTVSDMKNFASRGGIIGFIPKRRKVGIEINLGASRNAGVKISSKLLEVATLVPGRARSNAP